MILKLKDISVFKANWENKAKNITEIQKELNLSYNSMVFVDNNQVERDFIRKTLLIFLFQSCLTTLQTMEEI